MKAVVVYYSHKGKTARYGREIAFHLYSQGVSVSFCSTEDFKVEKLEGCDLLVLGCWTSGWFIFNQYPHKEWVQFASNLPADLPESLILFSTYKFRTGSMFKNMRKHLSLTRVLDQATMESKIGLLTKEDKSLLDEMVSRARHRKGVDFSKEK